MNAHKCKLGAFWKGDCHLLGQLHIPGKIQVVKKVFNTMISNFRITNLGQAMFLKFAFSPGSSRQLVKIDVSDFYHGYSGSVGLGWTLGSYIFNNLFAWFWCTKKENSSLGLLELKNPHNVIILKGGLGIPSLLTDQCTFVKIGSKNWDFLSQTSPICNVWKSIWTCGTLMSRKQGWHSRRSRLRSIRGELGNLLLNTAGISMPLNWVCGAPLHYWPTVEWIEFSSLDLPAMPYICL